MAAIVNSGAGLVTAAPQIKTISPSGTVIYSERCAFDLDEQDRLTEQLIKSDLVLIGPGLWRIKFRLDNEKKVVRTQTGVIAMAEPFLPKAALPFSKPRQFLPHQRSGRLIGL